MCCVVFRDCTEEAVLDKKISENKPTFCTPRYNFYTPIPRLPSKVEATKNKISIANIIIQILYLSRVRDGFWGKFMNYDATRIRKIYDFPRGKCFLRTGDKNFLAYTV